VDLSWVWEMSKPERAYMICGLIGSAMVGAAYPFLGFFLSKMITVFYNTDPHEIRTESTKYALIFVGMGVFQMVGSFFSKWGIGVVTERLAVRVRERTFDKMLHLDVAWYDKTGNSPGALAQSLATDAIAVRALAGESTGTSVSQTVTLLLSLGVAFYQSWVMTLVLLALLPIIGLSFGLQASFVQGASGAAMQATNDAGNVASQALLNIRTICAFGLEQVCSIMYIVYCILYSVYCLLYTVYWILLLLLVLCCMLYAARSPHSHTHTPTLCPICRYADMPISRLFPHRTGLTVVETLTHTILLSILPYIHTPIHPSIHTYIHPYIHIHTYIHTHRCPSIDSSPT
jgi:hypothetical protein